MKEKRFAYIGKTICPCCNAVLHRLSSEESNTIHNVTFINGYPTVCKNQGQNFVGITTMEYVDTAEKAIVNGYCNAHNKKQHELKEHDWRFLYKKMDNYYEEERKKQLENMTFTDEFLEYANKYLKR